MKRLTVWLCLLLMTGCAAQSREPEQRALEVRTSLMEAGSCSFTADVTANYGDRVYAFVLACRYENGEAQLEVLEPKTIAGIRAETSQNGTELIFESVELEFGQLANGFVSPVAVPWLLVQCWVEEYIAYAGADGELERVTYLRGYNDEELVVDTWFHGNTPVYAEVVHDGVRCVSIEIHDFQMIPQNGTAE